MNYVNVRPLPLSETTYYILFALKQKPMHGYAIIQKVKEISKDEVNIGAGTLYGALNNLTTQGLISKLETDAKAPRRKSYALTKEGERQIQYEFERMRGLVALSGPAFASANVSEESKRVLH